MPKQAKQTKKPKQIESTEYKLICRKKTDPELWFIKCICKTKPEAEKYMQILKDVSDMYLELKIEPVTIYKMI